MDRTNPAETSVSASTAQQVQFACPFSGAQGYNTDGFVGAWSPHRPLHVISAADSAHAAQLRGPNWFLCSAVAHLPTGQRPKIHADVQHDRALAFRGYVVDPTLHQFSEPAELWRHWGDGGGRCPNGVFATALIEGDSRLTLKTDAFGFSPLYYRVLGDLVLFGTKPDLLVVDQAELDPLGTASVMAHNHPLGDRTLLRDVYRCPFGTALRFEGSVDARHDTWFSADDLPEPERPLDDAQTAQVEAAFNKAVRRCTALDYGTAHVPLTSGHDSRRILAALLNDGHPFASTTVRVYRKGALDLDARYAAEMAQRFGFEHQVVDLPSPEGYAEDDEHRRREVCAETSMHDGWVESLVRALPSTPTLVMDGFLGDVLGGPGYRMPGGDPDPNFYKDPAADIEVIADDVASTPLHRHVAEAFRPGEAARDELRRYLAPVAGKRNVAELALILLRQRRATALWSQQLMPPEHMAASPYTDLDYIRTVMAIRPEDRWENPLQRACLERFHPELAAVGGSRDIPDDATPVGAEGNRQRSLACIRRLARDLDPARDRNLLRERLTPVGQAIATASWLAPGTIRRWHWMLRPVCEALLHDRVSPAVWRTGADAMRPPA